MIAMETLPPGWDFTITATDLSEEMLAKAAERLKSFGERASLHPFRLEPRAALTFRGERATGASAIAAFCGAIPP